MEDEVINLHGPLGIGRRHVEPLASGIHRSSGLPANVQRCFFTRELGTESPPSPTSLLLPDVVFPHFQTDGHCSPVTSCCGWRLARLHQETPLPQLMSSDIRNAGSHTAVDVYPPLLCPLWLIQWVCQLEVKLISCSGLFLN